MIRFFLLPFADKLLLFKVSFLLIFVRVTLFLLPLLSIRRALNFLIPKSPITRPEGIQTKKKNIVWAIGAVSRRIRFTENCLVKALVVDVLFKGAGYPAILHIGVAKKKTSSLEAHAWVESEGQVVIGEQGNDGPNFIPLHNLDRMLL